MKLKDYSFPLRRIKWEDIEIGEIFGVGGCLNILIKKSKCYAMFITDDWCSQFLVYKEMRLLPLKHPSIGQIYEKNLYSNDGSGHVLGNKFYKLPKDIQQLWCN